MNMNINTTVPPTLDALALAWQQAKAQEERAKEERLAIEAALVAQLPAKEEGTASHKTDAHKITVTYKLIRKVDTAQLRQHWNELSVEAQSCFKWTADVALSDLRRASESGQREAARFLTTGPGKPAVKIEGVA